MNPAVRFSGLVRKGLSFRRHFDAAKQLVGRRDFEWYPYDSFTNLFQLQTLMRATGLSLGQMVSVQRVIDIGAADGALSFFLESLGYNIDCWDCSSTNMNRMRGLDSLAKILGSKVEIHDVDLDGRFEFSRQYGLALFLGCLYHLKNPFYALETLGRHARFCFLSTRVARLSGNREIRLDTMPVAWLLDAGECNSDKTNYWIFSPPGLLMLARRAGWRVLASLCSGPSDSDPASRDGDERMFLLLESNRFTQAV